MESVCVTALRRRVQRRLSSMRRLAEKKSSDTPSKISIVASCTGSLPHMLVLLKSGNYGPGSLLPRGCITEFCCTLLPILRSRQGQPSSTCPPMALPQWSRTPCTASPTRFVSTVRDESGSPCVGFHRRGAPITRPADFLPSEPILPRCTALLEWSPSRRGARQAACRRSTP